MELLVTIGVIFVLFFLSGSWKKPRIECPRCERADALYVHEVALGALVCRRCRLRVR